MSASGPGSLAATGLALKNRTLERQNEDVPEADIQLVTDEAGQPTAVIVPIALWREIASERETAYLFKSETMRQRLLAALERGSGVPLDDAAAKLGL